MKPCIRCHRHVRRAEPRCPFCGAPLCDAPAPPPRAAWGLGLGPAAYRALTRGHLGTFPARDLVGLLLAHAGRLEKYGA